MDRREFLRGALTLAPALVVVPPVVSYFLPPAGGWLRYSGFDFIKHVVDADMRTQWARAYNDMMQRHMDRLVNPPLIDSEAAIRRWAGALNASHLLRPADVNWFLLDVAHV